MAAVEPAGRKTVWLIQKRLEYIVMMQRLVADRLDEALVRIVAPCASTTCEKSVSLMQLTSVLYSSPVPGSWGFEHRFARWG